ncbi:2TM domain-containing protein [Herbaspirillum sp. NPDC087042]|uniref:2TM domain-containing protein n=1 Tax=Herbaspirillum sp. NPDC087042 TaxID=3364004 RepID=UPI0038212D0D
MPVSDQPESVSPDQFRQARRRVERQLGFLRHLALYVVVNAGLVTLNLLTAHHHWWSLGPLLGWGIGLLFHALGVFGRFPAGWKQAMIERELRRH